MTLQEQVEAARKGLDQAKEEGLKLHQSSDSDDDSIPPNNEEPTPTRRPRKHKEKGAPSTRVSGRLRGTPVEDISLTQVSLDRERSRRGAWVNSTPLHKEVPEKHRSGLRGRGATKESVSLASSENQKVQTNQQLSNSTTVSPTLRGPDQKNRNVPSPHPQPNSPSSSVPSSAASPGMDRNSGGQSSVACREDTEEHVGEALSDTVQQSKRDRRISASSDSICSPEHHSDHDGQLTLSPTLTSPNSRSPRKRQSAEREILKGLPEDSPSAKVLRKLPGRLVTVVEEKEPRRRRRGASGGAHTEGSSEETEHAEPVQDPASRSSDVTGQTLKDSPPKSTTTSLASSPPQQEQEQVSSPSQSSPGRSQPPYSPTHHSPDMPVLRNLPVRRRLETESRMAAQLGEQFVGRGRGIDRRSALSPKKHEANADRDDSNVNHPVPLKRKRGRPPKTPPRALELPEPKMSQKTSPEQSPPVSPKRKRGRPRKDSTTSTTCGVDDEQLPTSSSPSTPVETSQETNLAVSDVTSVTLPTVSTTSPISSPTVNLPTPSNAALEPTSEPDSQTNQTTTSASLSYMHEDALDESPFSHGDTTHTSPNPIIAESDSQTSTLQTPAHNTSTACVSETSTSSPTLQLPIHLEETPANTVPDDSQQYTLTPVLDQNSQVTDSENMTVSGIEIETELNQLTCIQYIDHLQHSDTQVEITYQPLHETSLQDSVEPICEEAVPSCAPQQSTQPCPVPALTSGTEPESATPEPPVIPSESTIVQESIPVTDQALVLPSQSQLVRIIIDPSHSSLILPQTSCVPSPSNPTETTVNSSSTPDIRDDDPSQPQNMTVAENHEGENPAKEEAIERTVEMEVDSVDGNDTEDIVTSQPKRRKIDSLPKEQTISASDATIDAEPHDPPKNDGPEPSEEESCKETKSSAKKRRISRQSSQESVRSSSPSSVSSCGTRSSRSKKTGEVKRPVKRKREDIKSDKDKTEKGSSQKSSSSSSSDSEDSSSRNKCLTRSAQKQMEKDGRIANNDETSKRQRAKSDKKSQNTNTTDGESSSEANSRVIRKSNASPEPEVLGKRCSALNAAAKLLAMRGRGPDTPSPSPKNKPAGQQSKPQSSDKSSKPKGKAGPDSPKTSKAGSGRQTPSQSIESPQSSAARSTRQRPGSLVPPLETERVKKEEKKKSSDPKEEGEDENRETRSLQGHSACSSISSERRASSSRSRSSSISSQRTHSRSSQSTEPPRSRSRAASSGSDTERGKSIRKNSDGGRGRESRRERRSQKHEKLEISAGSSDGTPDRVLRSVAALAAAQARTPANNTRSSSSQHRHSKT